VGAETVQQLLRERAEGTGADRVGLRYADRTWTWREHLAEAAAEAGVLIAAHDPQRPLHVGTLLGNTPEMLRAMAAAGLGGYVLCGINTTRRGDGLLADVRRADCQFLLTDEEHLPLVEGLDLAGVTVIDVAAPDWATRLADGPDVASLEPYREVCAMDTLMMIFTSGTSGDPKAVQVPHIFPVFSGGNLVDRFAVTADDVCYVSMPLFHSNAVVAGWAVAATSGATIVPARFSASRFLDDVRRYGATYMNYVGKPLAYVLATPERPDDADNPLRVAFGNEASDRDIEEFARRFGCQVTDGFGSTESAVIVTRPPGTPRGSIGQGMEGVAIYDAATVTECEVARFDEHGVLVNPERAIGQLVNTQGAGMFQGYYNDEAANRERMAHGMYWSGDLAYRDADGWIYLAGRTADWMRVDGENLAAAPIERIIQRLPAVALVAVYAVPDPHAGDQVMAAIVLQDDATLSPAELSAFLADQADLPTKGWPRYVRIAPSLPSTATNKVLKRDLIAQGATAGDGVLWVREERGTAYTATPGSAVSDGGSAPSTVAPA
jgi:fatty-acyl-CoA synthase